MFKIKFTDNTYITGADITDSAIRGDYILFNNIICASSIIDQRGAQTITKTDLDGNVWEIHTGDSVFLNNYVSINGNVFRLSNQNRTGGLIFVVKDGNNYKLANYYWQGGLGALPYEWRGTSGINTYGYQYITYNDSANYIGTAITIAETVTSRGKVIDYIPNVNFITANVFNYPTDTTRDAYTKIAYLSSGFENVNSSSVGINNVTISLNNSIDDYDPLHPTPEDPYSNAGDSGTGGGGGSWDDGSDPVGIPNIPSVGATNTGFISLFVPSQSQLKSVAEYMWGGLFDLSTWKRLFEDPMDCILGLSVVPVSVPTSGSANITVGNIELSGISLPVASQQYVEVDCGSLTVTPYFGSYLDYEPYTKMALFVPYSGVHTVNADDLMGRTVTLVYHIDILTGSLVAFLKCGDSVLYEFNGACSSNIPVNSMNYASTIENAIRIATNIGTTVATAGASAPLSAGTEATKTAQNVARGISLAGSTADGALSLKPNIDRAGSLGGTTGLLGNQTPYFIVTRPRLCKPKDQNKIKGYPAFINYSVSDLVGKGYTEFDTILLKNLYLTDDEKNELESILMGGVYL